jgi:hypothetical protein
MGLIDKVTSSCLESAESMQRMDVDSLTKVPVQCGRKRTYGDRRPRRRRPCESYREKTLFYLPYITIVVI